MERGIGMKRDWGVKRDGMREGQRETDREGWGERSRGNIMILQLCIHMKETLKNKANLLETIT